MKSQSSNNLTKLTGLVLFLISLWLFFTHIDLSLFLHWQQSIALTFSEYLSSPAGISKYLSVYLLDSFHKPIGGKIILTLIFLSLYLSLAFILRKWKDRPCFHPLLILALIPTVFLLAQYMFPIQILVSLTLGLIIAALYTSLNIKNTYLNLLITIIFAFITFLSSGTIGLIILIQTLLLSPAPFSPSPLSLSPLPPSPLPPSPLSLSPLLLPLPLLFLLNSSLSLKQIFIGQFLVEEDFIIPKITYLALSNILVLIILFKFIERIFPEYNSEKTLRVKLMGYLIALSVLNTTTHTNINKILKKSLTLEQAAFSNNWEEVLEIADPELCSNRIILFQVNRALYHQGLLLENLFHYQQIYGDQAIFLDDQRTSRLSITSGAFYLDLGYVNEGRHWSNEAHSGAVYHPVVLKQLVIAHCAIGDMQLASKYLNTLSKSRIHRDWAKKYLQMIKDGTINVDPQIVYLRNNNPKTDFFAGTNNPINKLSLFHKNNPKNKMALEYMVTAKLLKHQLGNVIKLIPEFRKLGYEKLPRAVEEAILLYMSNSKTMNVNLSSYTISEQTFEEFKDFTAKMKNASSKNQALQILSSYSHTYWHYVLFSSPYSKQDHAR